MNLSALTFAIAVTGLIAIACAGATFLERKRRRDLEKRFSVIVDADAEASRIVKAAEEAAAEREAVATNKVFEAEEKAKQILDTAEKVALERESSATAEVERLEGEQKKAEGRLSGVRAEIEILRNSYAEKKEIFDRLLQEIAIFDERLSFAEMGVYEPHFDFDTSDDFKSAVEKIKAKQKALISAKAAVICTTNWQVDGSIAKGRTMTDRNIRLTLRAFNNECDAAIANIRWNNANAMEKRIENARKQIDKHNASNRVFITDDFFSLKLDELRATHEYREKIKLERDERAELARAAREEQKLIREMEEAEKEEAKYQSILEKAKKEAANAAGPKLEEYSQKIEALEHDLAAAHAKVERAKAMAEITKCGYVYIISNVGAFGPDCVKIGLTRRLDPSDRVRELGDASVPFGFDTHAIIYSEDAPALEHALHEEFSETRINAKNMRKEFFRVTLEEVESAVKRLAPDATFFRDIEAQEFHETLALRKALLKTDAQKQMLQFPAEL